MITVSLGISLFLLASKGAKMQANFLPTIVMDFVLALFLIWKWS